MIGRSQQSVTINPEKLKAAVHKLSEAENYKIRVRTSLSCIPLKLSNPSLTSRVTGTGLSSKVKIRGGVIPGYRHRKASFLSRSGKGVIWGQNTTILKREIGNEGRRKWTRWR
ncbi:hypothetical protein D5086_010006 [Populus alba]|uniref:Uncharacterized protein n=1 Tax=Populus alba TaxID=43335 RepID=A0ACC4C8W3_POPAL